ncbi:MAG: iron ABC transporter permease [Gammaproteobacteria bacterium]|nr:iron ABC transporter permease [Gammaproteobacteria bacterium]
MHNAASVVSAQQPPITARKPAFRHILPRNLWGWSSVLLALLLAMPVLVIAGHVLLGESTVWQHLLATVLPGYLRNSLWLALLVGSATVLIGTVCAWLTVMVEFPGRRQFSWLLLLPLALPAYITAYAYAGMLDFAGPLQSALRSWTGWQAGDYFFPGIRNLPGAALVLALVLYPYVYLLARAAFAQQSANALNVARSLGLRPLAVFWRVGVPLARPAIIAGLALVLMETLADYGTVKYFGVQTFTTGIFRTWFGMGDRVAAAQLASVLLLLILSLIVLERWSRGRRRFASGGSRYQQIARYRPSSGLRWLAVLACALPVMLGFVLPAGQLAWWTLSQGLGQFDRDFAGLLWNSFSLAGMTAVLAVALAVLLAFAARMHRALVVQAATRIAGMGYAIPGTVIAVGVIIPLALLDNQLDSLLRARFGVSSGLLLSGTLVALVFAYLVRFLSVSLQSVESGLAKISPAMDVSAAGLGCRPWQMLRRVHLPLLRGTMVTALLLVFVDVLKELPATLILRPFNFNTLAVRAYELADDEMLIAAAPSALCIALVGLLPVLLLSRSLERRTVSTAAPQVPGTAA